MKRTNLLFNLLILVITSVSAQQSTAVNQVPANIKSTFEMFYPNISKVTWQEEQGYYIPSFKVNHVETKLLIDQKGALVQTSSKIAVSALPGAASAYISANYAGQNITDAEQLTTINKSTRYEAVVGGIDLLFDSNGKFIGTVSGPLKQ